MGFLQSWFCGRGGCGGRFCAGRSCVMIRFDLMMRINWVERMFVSMRRS